MKSMDWRRTLCEYQPQRWFPMYISKLMILVQNPGYVFTIKPYFGCGVCSLYQARASRKSLLWKHTLGCELVSLILEGHKRNFVLFINYSSNADSENEPLPHLDLFDNATRFLGNRLSPNIDGLHKFLVIALDPTLAMSLGLTTISNRLPETFPSALWPSCSLRHA